jgi:hypothetical protein
MCIGAGGLPGVLGVRRRIPGEPALVIAVHTRWARSGSYAMTRAACTSSPAVSPCRLRITRRVESRIRLSNVVSSAKRCRSIIVCTNVESSTAEVGILVLMHPNPATRTAAASTTAKGRAIIGSNGIELQRDASTAPPTNAAPRRIAGAGTKAVRRQVCAVRLRGPLKQDRGVPYPRTTPRRTARMCITC